MGVRNRNHTKEGSHRMVYDLGLSNSDHTINRPKLERGALPQVRHERIVRADWFSPLTLTKTMKFQIGKYYQHTTGEVMHVICHVSTFFHGDTMLAESEGGLSPVGKDECSAQNWIQVSGWRKETYECNNIASPDSIERTPQQAYHGGQSIAIPSENAK